MEWNIPQSLSALPVDPEQWALDLQGGSYGEQKGFDPDSSLERCARLDTYTAEHIHERLGDYLTYSGRTWYIWDGRVHRPADSDTPLRAVVRAYALALERALWEIRFNLERDLETFLTLERTAKAKAVKAKLERVCSYERYQEQISGSRGVENLVRALADVCERPSDHFDDGRWLAVRNGVYDLDAVRRDRRWDLLPHDPSRPVYRFLDVEDHGDPCLDQSTWNTEFRRFLSTSVEDEEQGRFLMRALAAALIGGEGATRRIVSLQGAPSSGKSMLLSVLEDFCSGTDYYASPGLDAIEHGARAPEHARWRMRNARISTFSEARKKLDQMFLLNYSGGDSYAVEAKYQNGLTVRPHGIIFIANNYPLNVDKTDLAMLDRLAVVYFPHSFTDTATDVRYRRDPALGDKIKGDRYGTLQMLKSAYLAYLDSGLDRTERMQSRLAGETDDSNYVAEWLSESGRFVPLSNDDPKSKRASATEAYKSYKRWEIGMHLPGSEQISRADFFRLMEEAGHHKIKSSGVMVLAGLKDRGPILETP